MSTVKPESFQIPIEAAEAYEAEFVPAFFAQWAPSLCAAAGLAGGQRVLDVACGTGIVARRAAEVVGPVNVVGVDLNAAMLTVARRVAPDIDWQQGDVTALPLPDAAFDVVVSQMALMFFPDRAAALTEMRRVTRPGGVVAVLVPGPLEVQPAYGPFVEMAGAYAGAAAHSLLGTYFSCGHLDDVVQLFEDAALEVTHSRTERGVARFPSVDALVATEVRSTPLGGRITAEVYEQIVSGARDVLAPFTSVDGALAAPFDCSIVAARRR